MGGRRKGGQNKAPRIHQKKGKKENPKTQDNKQERKGGRRRGVKTKHQGPTKKKPKTHDNKQERKDERNAYKCFSAALFKSNLQQICHLLLTYCNATCERTTVLLRMPESSSGMCPSQFHQSDEWHLRYSPIKQMKEPVQKAWCAAICIMKTSMKERSYQI